jgi:putative hydrolase of the HAD superfamily
MTPFDRLTALFLDLGNTLVSIDFAWVRDELDQRGVAVAVSELQRAEAAARPSVSRAVRQTGNSEGGDAFHRYLTTVLGGVASAAAMSDRERDGLAADLVPVLRVPGQSQRLWSNLLPGVRQTLETFHRAGLPVVVVSNSDGSAADIVDRQGLRDLVAGVVDSHVIGIEKPDRGIFDHALALVGASPGDVLHVGDIYDVDVVGARGAGLHAMLIDPYGDWPDVDCARITSIAELPGLIMAA